MNRKQMHNSFLCTATFALSSFVYAQTGAGSGSVANQQTQTNQQQSGTQAAGMAGAMTGGSSAADANPQMMKDKMFLRKAAEGGMAEIQLGQLAAQKGSSDDVKQFGQKMVDDHTALNNDMKPFCDSMGVKPPTKLSKKDQMEYDKLNGMSGDAFDKEYLAYMSKDHHNDVKEFKAEEQTAGDPSLKAAVSKGLGVIQQHTMMVDQLAKSKGAMVAGQS